MGFRGLGVPCPLRPAMGEDPWGKDLGVTLQALVLLRTMLWAAALLVYMAGHSRGCSLGGG